MANLSDERIDIHVAEATALSARVRVSLPRGAFSQLALVRGFLYGPKSRMAATLPVRHPLTDRSTATQLAGEAVIPEPCYASDDLPMYYELHLEIHDGEQIERRMVQLELRPAQPPKLL